MKVIALEGAPHGVTSSTACPGLVRTPLVEHQIEAQARSHGMAEENVTENVILREPAIKRLIEPGDVAELVAYLYVPATSFASRASSVLDGGSSAH